MESILLGLRATFPGKAAGRGGALRRATSHILFALHVAPRQRAVDLELLKDKGMPDSSVFLTLLACHRTTPCLAWPGSTKDGRNSTACVMSSDSSS